MQLPCHYICIQFELARVFLLWPGNEVTQTIAGTMFDGNVGKVAQKQKAVPVQHKVAVSPSWSQREFFLCLEHFSASSQLLWRPKVPPDTAFSSIATSKAFLALQFILYLILCVLFPHWIALGPETDLGREVSARVLLPVLSDNSFFPVKCCHPQHSNGRCRDSGIPCWTMPSIYSDGIRGKPGMLMHVYVHIPHLTLCYSHRHILYHCNCC